MPGLLQLVIGFITKHLLHSRTPDICPTMYEQVAHGSAEQILRDELVKRQIRNPSYSISAFARDLGISQTYVSLMLAGKRRLPLKRALTFSAALGFDEERSAAFVRAVTDQAMTTETSARTVSKTPRAFNYFSLEVDRFKVISQWYHLPILDLTTIKGFKPDCQWVARKLGITAVQVRDAVDRLERLGLLEITSGRWIKTQTHLAVPTGQSESAVRTFHKQMIEKTLVELNQTDASSFAAREIAGTTMAIDPAKIPEIKKRIQKFRKELAAFATDGECSALYQLNVQFFSLLKRGKK